MSKNIKLTDAVTIQTGISQARIKESFDKDAPKYIYYGQRELEKDMNVVSLDKKDDKKYIKTNSKVATVKTGDVVFSLISGKCCIVGEEHDGYLFTVNYVKLEIKNNVIDKKYLVYLLNENKYIEKQLRQSIQGSTILRYTANLLKELTLPTLPGLEKQKQIGEFYFNITRLKYLKMEKAKKENLLLLHKLKEM